MPQTLPDHLIDKMRTLPLRDAAYRLVYHDHNTYPPINLTEDDAAQLLANLFGAIDLPEIRNAYRAAVKLERDHSAYFAYRDDGDYGRALAAACNKAKALNPGFLEETYMAAGYSLGISMR